MGPGTIAVLVAVGVALAFALLIFGFYRARQKIIGRNAELQERWCSLDRRARSRIKRSLRRGQAPPPEYAAIALDVLDASEAEDSRRPGHSRRLHRVAVRLAAGMLVGGALIAFAHTGGVAVGVILESYFATIAIVVIWASRRVGTARRNRPAARAATLGLLDRPGEA